MENGCLVPDWFDGPVIPADLFHDKEDTDVDTGDQQAVDDAEYDDGSSTDSEWSDDSIIDHRFTNHARRNIVFQELPSSQKHRVLNHHNWWFETPKVDAAELQPLLVGMKRQDLTAMIIDAILENRLKTTCRSVGTFEDPKQFALN
ncbi:hypothetical protein GQR58_009973 [Nymphon striatum]|nr:hypothetical protein GQR58_009973 [Nymphon striatum]